MAETDNAHPDAPEDSPSVARQRQAEADWPAALRRIYARANRLRACQLISRCWYIASSEYSAAQSY